MDNMDSVSGRYIDMDRARAMVDAKSEEWVMIIMIMEW